MLRVDRHGDAPVERRARNAEVIEALLDEIDHLVAARHRLDEIRMALDIREDAILIFAHLKEISFFRDFLHGAVAVRAAAVLVQLVLRPVAFARRAVQPFVLAFINVALRVNAAENLLHDTLVALLRRADEIIVADVQPLPERLEARDDLIGILNWLYPGLLGLLLDLQPMLIRARQEKHIVAREAVIPRDGIGNRRAIRMTDMQLRTRIIDRRRDIKWLLFSHQNIPPCWPAQMIRVQSSQL